MDTISPGAAMLKQTLAGVTTTSNFLSLAGLSYLNNGDSGGVEILWGLSDHGSS
jgi:hypothetical protein